MEVLDRTAGEAQLFPARSVDPQPVALSAERRSAGSHEPVDGLGAGRPGGLRPGQTKKTRIAA